MYRTPEGIDVPFLAVRLPDFHTCCLPSGQEDALVDLLARFPGVCEAVWFATDYGFPKPETHADSARRMEAMAKKLRAKGIVCQLQISNTLGHSQSSHLDNSGITWNDRMVGETGIMADHCHCPMSPGFREYIRASMTEYARFKPEFVWIDDDLRMRGHSPVNLACFCDHCLALFSERNKQSWTREALCAALNEPDAGVLRAAWMDFNQFRLADFSRLIAGAVWAVSPDTRFGIQQASAEWAFYNGGCDIAQAYRAITRDGALPGGCRGGGGHYTDYYPRGALEKMFEISRQFACLPDGVPVRVPEIENFVHGAIGKTSLGTAIEAAIDIAAGCNGLSIANLMYQNEEIGWHAGTFRKLADWKPYFDALLRENGESVHAGLAVAFPASQPSRSLMPGEPAWSWTSAGMGEGYRLGTIGVPVSTAPAAAYGYILTAEAAKGVDEPTLRAMIRKGLLTDGLSAAILQERGLGACLGAKLRKLESYNSPEYFTNDPLNGSTGAMAFLDNPFNRAPNKYAVEPICGNVRVLGEFRAADGLDRGLLTVGIELPDGAGRVGIIGRNAWETVMSGKRRTQIVNLADWVTGHTAPVCIDTVCQVAPIVRCDADGRVRTVTLLNQGFDDTPELEVRVRLGSGQKGIFRWMAPECADVPLSATRREREWLLRLPPMERWSIGTIVCG